MEPQSAFPFATELKSHPDLRIGHCESLLVMIWRGSVTPLAMDLAISAQADLVTKYPLISVLTVITETVSGAPDADLSRSAAQAAWRFGTSVRGTAVVLLADGGTATATQLGLRGLLSLASHHRVFAGFDPAMEWFRKLAEADASPMPMATTIKDFVEASRAG